MPPGDWQRRGRGVCGEIHTLPAPTRSLPPTLPSPPPWIDTRYRVSGHLNGEAESLPRLRESTTMKIPSAVLVTTVLAGLALTPVTSLADVESKDPIKIALFDWTSVNHQRQDPRRNSRKAWLYSRIPDGRLSFEPHHRADQWRSHHRHGVLGHHRRRGDEGFRRRPSKPNGWASSARRPRKSGGIRSI